MNTKKEEDSFNSEQLLQRVADLEDRIAGLEAAFKQISFLKSGSSHQSDKAGMSPVPQPDPAVKNETIESRIGQHGMAWMGNIVLLFGILFLTQFLQSGGQQILSLLFGFISVAGVYLLGNYTKKSLPYMSRLFHYNGHLLLFIQVLRLTLFEESRMIHQPVVSYSVIVILLSGLLYLAYRNRSQLLEAIVLLMAAVAAVASGNTYFLLSMLVAMAATALFLTVRREWWTGLILSVVMVYLAYITWLFGNPLTGGGFGIIETHQYGHLFLFVIALLYSLTALLPGADNTPSQKVTATILLNGISFSVAFLLTVLAFFTKEYSVLFGSIAVFCLGYSILLKVRGTWKNIASMYAIYSFVALSITLAGVYHFPKSFLLLAIESLLVVSMALWFRSRFITIMNTLLFVGLLITYLAVSGKSDPTNFAFALVALVTARITNWKKKRLDIRTELIRNVFLVSGALMLLYSLRQAVPPHLVTVSWALAAVVFFILSVVIHNMKYRWLSIITMVVTVGYLFIVDLSHIGLGYRIVAFMFIAAISLGISIYYSRKQTENKDRKAG
jgi:hypothetical protein